MAIGIGIGLATDRKHPLLPTPVHGCRDGKRSKEREKNMHGSENTPHYRIVQKQRKKRRRKQRTGSIPTRSPIHTFRAHLSHPSFVPHRHPCNLQQFSSKYWGEGGQVFPLHHLCPNLFLAIAKGKERARLNTCLGKKRLGETEHAPFLGCRDQAWPTTDQAHMARAIEVVAYVLAADLDQGIRHRRGFVQSTVIYI